MTCALMGEHNGAVGGGEEGGEVGKSSQGGTSHTKTCISSDERLRTGQGTTEASKCSASQPLVSDERFSSFGPKCCLHYNCRGTERAQRTGNTAINQCHQLMTMDAQ